MNRTSLLAASPLALAIALGAGAAQAAEPLTAQVSGFMFGGVAWVDTATTDGDFSVIRDGEIHFTFRGVSDNGLTFDGRVELEAFTDTDDQIDENWVRVSGPFGAVMIGGNDTAKTELAVGVLYAPGDKVGYYDDDANQGLTGGIDGSGDQVGIHYYTPSFAGFSAGVSYLPSVDSDGPNDTNTAVFADGENVFSVGLVYEYEFTGAGISLALGAGYEDVDTPTGDMESWNVGGTISGSGITLAAYWEENFDETNDWNLGLAYETGPWTFAGGFGHSEAAGAADVDTFAGWASYAVAPGVSFSAGAAHASDDNDDAMIAATWVSLNF
ncbi:porin [Rhodovulum sp. DZ06]|uniref:porin n=1 Tax=Rhodovulum sp. DZ06 TaxID=3425126 RepID=UPI003D32EABE